MTTKKQELHELIKTEFKIAKGEKLSVRGPLHKDTLDLSRLNYECKELDKFDLYFEFTLWVPPPPDIGVSNPNMICANLYVSYLEVYEIPCYSNRVYTYLKGSILRKTRPDDFSEFLRDKVTHLIERLKDRKPNPTVC